MSTFYSQADKKRALDMRAAGETRAHVARLMKADPTTIKRWEQEAREAVAKPITGTDMVALGENTLPPSLQGALAKVLAESLPTGTPEDFYKAAVMQKIAKAVESMKIPPVTKMSDVKTLIALGNSIMLPNAGKKQNVSVAIRLDRLGSAPRDVLDAEIVEDE